MTHPIRYIFSTITPDDQHRGCESWGKRKVMLRFSKICEMMGGGGEILG
jgi:hypothetical protein